MGEWVEHLVRSKYQTYRRLAEAIGMTESGFNRAVKAGTLNIENLLRLAAETGTSASHVFQLAGKADVDVLIRTLYGAASAHGLSKDALKVAELFDSLPTQEMRDLLLETAHAWKRAPTRVRSASSSPSIDRSTVSTAPKTRGHQT